MAGALKKAAWISGGIVVAGAQIGGHLGNGKATEKDVEAQAARQFFGKGRPATKAPAEVVNKRNTKRIPEYKTLRTFGMHDPNYAMWDDKIIQATRMWNERYSGGSHLPGWQPLNPNLVKAKYLYECRNDLEAFKHNPAQFGNEDDPGLIVMRDGGEAGIPPAGYPDLYGYKAIPRRSKLVKRKGKKPKRVYYWDFNEPGIITPELTVKYSPGWLYHKNCVFKNIIVEKPGDVKEYKLRPGDTLSEVEKKLGTTVETIQRYTDWIKDPDDIKAGKKVKYKESYRATAISGFRGWDEAIKGYNGGGDKNYLEGIMRIYNKRDDPNGVSSAAVSPTLQNYLNRKLTERLDSMSRSLA